MENWLSICVGIFLISMALYGHYKGFIRLAVSMAALVVTLVVVNIAMPQVREFLKKETPVYDMIRSGMLSSAGIDEVEEDRAGEPARQREIIENLNLPQQLKTALIENNNSEVYDMMGVNRFIDYITTYLADSILNIAAYILVFILVFILFQLVMRWLDIMARLPILSGLNKIAGAALGAAEGLLFLWIASLAITAFAGTAWGMQIIRQIEASAWLSYLYNHNFLSNAVLGVIIKMF